MRKFNESVDISLAINKINQEYPDFKVKKIFDEKWHMWVDDDWKEDGDYKDEYSWYKVFGLGSAEEEVIKIIIDWYEKNSNIKLSEQEYSKLSNSIKKEYDFLNYK